MPTPRQQRQTGNRRRVSTNLPGLPPAFALGASVEGGPYLDVQALSIAVPPSDPGTPIPLVVTGVPQILRLSDSTYPSEVYLLPDGLTVRVQWAGAVIGDAEQFRIGGNDPGLRTTQGAYAAPGLIGLPQDNPPELTYTATAQLDGSVWLALAPVPGSQIPVYNPFYWYVTELGSQVTTFFSNDGNPHLTFSGAVAAGMHIQYNGARVTGNGRIIAVPFRDIVTVA